MRRVIVRQSPVHGRGVFALRPLVEGERILEYKGEVVSWRNAVSHHRRHGIDGHTFLFGLSDGRVIDGSRGGNSSRWLNHACAANCEAVEQEGRIFILATRDIGAGAELFIDYQLVVTDELDDELRQQYQCRCGAMDCRRSMLADAQ